MATIGSVTKRDDGRYEGELRTLSVRAEILLLPVAEKASPSQPDYRVMSQGIEIGAGWIRTGQISGKEYVALSIAAPELGSKTLYANLGRAAGQTDPDVFALIWNPQDCGRHSPSRRSRREGTSRAMVHPAILPHPPAPRAFGGALVIALPVLSACHSHVWLHCRTRSWRSTRWDRKL